jgi:hypothetical protein
MKPQLSQKFMANGHEYVIMDYITITRGAEMKNITSKMAFGTDLKGLFAKINEIYKHCTTGNSPIEQLHKSAVVCLNLMDGINYLETNKREPYMELCALFINRVGEDHSTITKQQIDDKINDWIVEGYDPNDFFLLALNSVPDLKNQWMESKSKQKK